MNIVTLLLAAAAVMLVTCIPSGNTAGEGGRVVINEFMTANNEGGPADEYGDHDDWIELYNAGDASVNIGVLSLTDDSLQLHSYSLPDTQLPAGGFVLIWADDEPMQGKWHAPFKLSWKNGDEIILTQGKDRIVDRYRFFPEDGNPLARVPGTSYGRAVDGDTLWGQQIEPTPGTANRGIRTPTD